MRVKQIRLTPEAIFGLVAGVGDFECATSFPKDCRGLRCGIDESGNLALLIESSAFPDVVEGAAIEQICPTYHDNATTLHERVRLLELAVEHLNRAAESRGEI